MAQRPEPQYEETNDPRNPPRAVLNKNVRRAAVWVYVGPLVALLVVAGLALIYWMGRGPGNEGAENSLNPSIGTTGERLPEQEREGERQQGGFDPGPRPDSTEEELEFRGGSDVR